MKVGIYTPYLDTLGGGERYMLTIAEIFSEKHEVDLFIDEHLKTLDPEKLVRLSEERFNLKLSKLKLVNSPFGHKTSVLDRYLFLKKYDLLIYLTDGSIFYSSSKKSFIHMQSPIINTNMNNPWNKAKLSSWSLIIYNSNFTQENAEKSWKLKSKVVYPPVDVRDITPLKKEKIILSVGRFFGYLKDKKHELLISMFKELSRELKGWRLLLAGSAAESDKEYINDLKLKAKGLPIEFHPNLTFKDLVKLYGVSSIYWHAMGYGIEDPTKMEHFGITTVESMAAGCVPIVINKGGQREIVENDKSGFLWNDLNELKRLTLKTATNDRLRTLLSENAIQRAKIFSKERFKKEIRYLL